MIDYSAFLARKLSTQPPAGFDVAGELHPALFDYQRDVVRWGLRRGRAAFFQGTGLGKSLEQLVWTREVLRHAGGRALILAPLAVAQQTEAEAERFGIEGVRYLREDDGATPIVVTNYDLLHRFDALNFVAVVLDESSLLKHHDAATRTALIEAFRATPYRLACTATPAPNDHEELGNHAEFLGVCTRTEMLSTFFCHDGGDTQTWRLKGHAVDAFWRWMASWAVMMRKPSDIGYSDEKHVLPRLTVHQEVIPADTAAVLATGALFAQQAATLSGQRAARKASLSGRVRRAVEIVAREPEEPWLVWCDLNAEAEALVSEIPGAVQIAGSDDPEVKRERIMAFSNGTLRTLVTKPSIAGFGVNWQHCARMIFVGVTHSWEMYFQAVRRCWRFGQTRPVEVYVVSSEEEGAVVANLARKEEAAERMATAMVAAMAEVQRESLHGAVRSKDRYSAPMVRVPTWLRSEVA